MATLHIPPDHPTRTGHFPGNPIIPGALLLAEAVRVIASVSGKRLDVAAIKSAKFFQPVRPGDSVEIEYEISAKQEIRFQCVVGGLKVLTGIIDAASDA